MRESVDLCVIGAGPGGIAAALRAADYGLRTVLVEKESIGGVCLTAGCIPMKTLLASSACFAGLRKAVNLGVQIPRGSRIDWSSVQARKNSVIRRLADGLKGRLGAAKITVVCGCAELVSPTRVRVSSGTESAEIEAKSILLATGSSPVFPPNVILGARILDVSAAMELAELPRRVIIIGGGAAGCECATLFSELGVDTTLVESSRRLLPELDSDLGRFAAKTLAKSVRLILGKNLDSAEERAEGVSVQCGGQRTDADLLVAATGRHPNADGLGLERLGVAVDERGVVGVDSVFRTCVPSVLAIGDLIGAPFLAHAATAEAVAAVDGLQGHEEERNHALLPSCVFTHPEIASVGLSGESCREKGIACRIFRAFACGNGFSLANGEAEGFVKILADSHTDRILGVHAAGLRAADLMGEAMQAIGRGQTARSFVDVVRPHPTFSEMLSECHADFL